MREIAKVSHRERVAGDVLGEVLMMRFFLRRANKPMS
jgi:hypothetical protein